MLHSGVPARVPPQLPCAKAEMGRATAAMPSACEQLTTRHEAAIEFVEQPCHHVSHVSLLGRVE